MKKLNMLLLLAFFTASYGTKTSFAATNRIPVQQEERTIGSFNGIAAGGNLTVNVSMGNKESIRLEGDQDAISALITEVKGGILTIRPKTKWNDWSKKYNNAAVTIYITAKKVTSLTMSGSGTMEVENTINTSDLVATLSGSGSIKGTASLKSFTGVISGSGTLDLSGKANDSNLTISGSGNFKGKSFAVNELSIQISGSANTYIQVNKKINAVISGSGNVFYSGDAVVTKTVIGSGRVKKV